MGPLERDWIWVQTPGPNLTRAIIEMVASRNGISREQIMSRSSQRRFVLPRMEAYYEVWKNRETLSLPGIGRVFARDHSTIISGIQKWCKLSGLDYAEEKLRCGR